MPGFALLPTLAEPTSKLTFRLSHEEQNERNAWICGAHARGIDVKTIAYEVGLSTAHVYNIIRKSKPNKNEKSNLRPQKYKTPRDAALSEFWRETAHAACRGHNQCMDCFGRSMIIESEYDASGWPYDWAMYGQEKYIEMCS